MVPIYAVRVGDKYGPEYEEYLKTKLDNITFLNESISPFIRQWNKIRFFNLDVPGPVCVIDIDIELVNNYMELFDYPVQPGEFIGIPAHWKDTAKLGYSINGGFYKFYPQDTKYIYEKFVNDPEYWSTYYVKNETTCGPVNGEQYFVEDSVKEKLDLKLVPEDWVQRGYNGKFLDDGEVKLVHHLIHKIPAPI